MTDSDKTLLYCAFRLKMWGQGRGTYHNIDDDFAAGLLDNEWREYLDSLLTNRPT